MKILITATLELDSENVTLVPVLQSRLEDKYRRVAQGRQPITPHDRQWIGYAILQNNSTLFKVEEVK